MKKESSEINVGVELRSNKLTAFIFLLGSKKNMVKATKTPKAKTTW